jgi:hypothetical protein
VTGQQGNKVCGQVFRPEEGIVIGRQDEGGNVVLVVDPATLPPEISDALCRIGILGKVPERSLEQSPELGPCSLGQSPTRLER